LQVEILFPPRKNRTTPARFAETEIVVKTPLYTFPEIEGAFMDGAGKPGPGGGVAASLTQN
jgi:hypothetical protein